METVLIFAGGVSPGPEVVEELPHSDLTIAADSGYDRAVELGFKVDVLIGDLDSIETELMPNHLIVERYPVDKDATDLEIAIGRVLVEQPQRVVIVGGSGGRLDHELGIANLICSSRWSSIDEIDWMTDRGWAHVVHKRRTIHGDVGSMISLIPVGGDATGVSTRGLKWELHLETLEHSSTRGVSNRFASPVAEVALTSGTLLAVVPRV